MEVNVAPVVGNKARKRVRNEKQWKRNKQKENRYSPKTLPDLRRLGKCNHKKKNLKCNEITPQDVRKFHSAFYAKKEKRHQDNFILKYLKTKAPARRRRKIGQRKESETFTKMYIKTFTKPYKLVQVCQAMFLMILNIGVHRLRRISKTFLTTGQLPEDRRGGDRASIKNLAKKQSVMRFIESFKCIESHYCRSATSERKYVSSDLNIKKMWKMYQEQQNDTSLKVKECFFRNIFNKHYNIGFNTPRVDVCSKCTEISEKIKRAKNQNDQTTKISLMTELRIHKLKSKCFYEYLREEKEFMLTMSFDCQKNQVLPKIPDQIAYYSRQLYMYNFTIVVGSSTNQISKENVFCYTWTENIHAKSANEIASAVFYQLTTKVDLTNIKTVRLMADGCGSQNKNSILISMCAYWLTTWAPKTVKTIELIFPVPGHSFMPADRVFGNIEKKIRTKEVIVQPSEYLDIYKEHGKVFKLGYDCPVKDWKSYAKSTTKLPGQYHFKFSDCKRYYLKRVKNNPERFVIRGEVNYKVDTGVAKSIMKPHVKSMNDFGVGDIEPNMVKVGQPKLEDVNKLLIKHFGEDWRKDHGDDLLSYYKNVLEKNYEGDTVPENEPCEYLEEFLICTQKRRKVDSSAFASRPLKSKKRLCKLKDKLQKLDKLELNDIVCPICQSIFIEPVALPCFHYFCKRCFNGSIENNALCCPLCRLRIGSWLRTATKQNNLVNVRLWDFIKTKYPKEVDTRLKGEDLELPEEKLPLPRLSAPGEIRFEYEAELQRIRTERLQQEQKQIQETQLLIQKLEKEEQEAHRKYLERLKQDELLAKEIQHQESKTSITVPKPSWRRGQLAEVPKPRLKNITIDGYLAKIQAPAPTAVNSPLLTDDNTSTDGSTPCTTAVRSNSGTSPEVVPSYGQFLKALADKKLKNTINFWNKENGEIEKKEDTLPAPKEVSSKEENKDKGKGVTKSLLVSLPLPSSGVLQHKITETNRNRNLVPENRNLETGSVDSMQQELCFFKPIEKTSPTCVKSSKKIPLRVPSVRADREKTPSPPAPAPRDAAPSRAQYIEGLCQLRKLSLANNLPSAFVIALNILRVKRENAKNGTNIRLKKNGHKKTKKLANEKTNLRRTRSMGSITKDENETTPKKPKLQERKSNSDRKPHLRSDSKKSAKKICSSPTLNPKIINNDKLHLAVKNLSSPLEKCDVKKILQEQLRIEKLIEQEKKDLELAQQMDAEWNGRRHLRRAPAKRQVTLYALRPAKKLKV